VAGRKEGKHDEKGEGPSVVRRNDLCRSEGRDRKKREEEDRELPAVREESGQKES